MGRKIPAKKHRGVKDPLKQQAQRFQRIKDKINAPPSDPDEQPVPRSLLRLFAFQQPRAPDVKKKPKRQPAGPAAGSAVAALRRLPGEAGRAFSLRITSAVRALSHPDDQDYPQDLEETDTRGEYIAAQRERRQRKTRAARGRRGEGEGEGGAGAGPGGERLRKAQRRALKRKEQQKAKDEETALALALAGRELRYERVAFGDVAHAPPALPLPRMRAAQHALAHRAQAARPGRRDLLLSSMLSGGAGGAVKEGAGAARGAAGAGAGAGAGGAAEAERRERARLAAVAAYRALKKQRAHTHAHTGPRVRAT